MATLTSFRGFSQSATGLRMDQAFTVFSVSGENIVSSSDSEILIKNAQGGFQRFMGTFSYDATGKATGTNGCFQCRNRKYEKHLPSGTGMDKKDAASTNR